MISMPSVYNISVSNWPLALTAVRMIGRGNMGIGSAILGLNDSVLLACLYESLLIIGFSGS
jgi:hypothetical protein